jgi:hypothetical protein
MAGSRGKRDRASGEGLPSPGITRGNPQRAYTRGSNAGGLSQQMILALRYANLRTGDEDPEEDDEEEEEWIE